MIKFQNYSNANDSITGNCGGATAMQSGDIEVMEASALIEGPEEGDIIAVESPEQAQTDIPALFKVRFF